MPASRSKAVAIAPRFSHFTAMSDDAELLAANAAYYKAFLDRDVEAMSDIWAREDVSCIHPGWLALIGHAAIIASYRDIFRNPKQDSIKFADADALTMGDHARVFCVETVGNSLLMAANWFRRTDGGWLLIHHQASPLVVEPPEPRQNKQAFH